MAHRMQRSDMFAMRAGREQGALFCPSTGQLQPFVGLKAATLDAGYTPADPATWIAFQLGFLDVIRKTWKGFSVTYDLVTDQVYMHRITERTRI